MKVFLITQKILRLQLQEIFDFYFEMYTTSARLL